MQVCLLECASGQTCSDTSVSQDSNHVGEGQNLTPLELGAVEVQLGTEMPTGADDHALSANHRHAVSPLLMCKATMIPCGEVPPQWCEAGQATGAESMLGVLLPSGVSHPMM